MNLYNIYAMQIVQRDIHILTFCFYDFQLISIIQFHVHDEFHKEHTKRTINHLVILLERLILSTLYCVSPHCKNSIFRPQPSIFPINKAKNFHLKIPRLAFVGRKCNNLLEAHVNCETMAEAACCAQMLLFGTNPCNTDCWCNVLFIRKENAKKESNWGGNGEPKREYKKEMQKGN